MKIVQLIIDYWPVLVALGGVLDVVAGYLPDRWIPYVGLIKRLVVAMKNSRATGAVVAMAMVGLLVAGCFATINVNPETGAVKYTRMGAQEISGLIVEKDQDKISVSIEAVKSDSAADEIKATTELLRTVRTGG